MCNSARTLTLRRASRGTATAPCRSGARRPGRAAPRTQADLAGDRLQRQALGEQRARRVEAQVLDEMRRRLAGGLGEFAIEAALAKPACRASVGTSSAVEMILHPVDQRRERRVGRGLRLQQRAELRLVARPARIEHEVAGDQVGGRGAQIGLDQRQRHVDAGGDAGRGPDLAVDDVERVGIDRRAREVARPAARSSPSASPRACRRAGPPPPARRRRCRPSRSGCVLAAPPCAASARTSSRAIAACRPAEPPATSSVSGWPPIFGALQRHAAVGGDQRRRRARRSAGRRTACAAGLVGRAEHGGGAGDVEQLAAFIGQDEEAVRSGHWQKIDLLCHFCQAPIAPRLRCNKETSMASPIADRHPALSQRHPARRHRAGAGAVPRAGRQAAHDLEDARSGADRRRLLDRADHDLRRLPAARRDLRPGRRRPGRPDDRRRDARLPAQAGAPTARYVTSVCTGSLVLGAAGLLKGYKSACHWASRDLLAAFGAIPVAERVVRDRNRISGGGVTAGIDFGLTAARRTRGRGGRQVGPARPRIRSAAAVPVGRPEKAGAERVEAHARADGADAREPPGRPTPKRRRGCTAMLRAAADLRALQQGAAARVAGGAHLQLRVHLLRRLRRAGAGQCLPQLRRRLHAPADPAGPQLERRQLSRQGSGGDASPASAGGPPLSIAPFAAGIAACPRPAIAVAEAIDTRARWPRRHLQRRCGGRSARLSVSRRVRRCGLPARLQRGAGAGCLAHSRLRRAGAAGPTRRSAGDDPQALIWTGHSSCDQRRLVAATGRRPRPGRSRRTIRRPTSFATSRPRTRVRSGKHRDAVGWSMLQRQGGRLFRRHSDQAGEIRRDRAPMAACALPSTAAIGQTIGIRYGDVELPELQRLLQPQR